MPRQIIPTANAPISPLYSQGSARPRADLGHVGIDPVPAASPEHNPSDTTGADELRAILGALRHPGRCHGGGGTAARPADFGLNEEYARWFPSGTDPCVASSASATRTARLDPDDSIHRLSKVVAAPGAPPPTVGIPLYAVR
jgi:hypothetical protein